MCGIVAVLGRKVGEVAERGLESMSYRGVRSRTVETVGGAIGHVRLPIVGVGEENDQPVSRGRWLVSFVGEILDYRRWFPGDKCDIWAVVDSWTEHGPRAFCKFDGFWHVVAYDKNEGTLHVLADYLCQKPVYYRTRGVVAVASELDALASLAPVHPDAIYLSAVVKWGYCPDVRRTPYREIDRVLPGEHLTISRDGYVRTEVVDGLYPRTTADDELRAEIESAVKRRVTSSDVPVACLLSGGLDSSIVYRLASRYGDVRAYHVKNGEGVRYRLVAPNVVDLSYDGVSTEKALKYMQEPIDLGSLVPQVALSDAIAGSGGERVCLTGDGADELFGGYGRASRYDSQSSDVWHELVAWHLPRLDRVMMRNCVEVRSPFLSRRVAEAALALPHEARVDKKILRDLFRSDLPPGVADTEKRPLRTPTVGRDRELNSQRLVQIFMGRFRDAENT